MRKRTTTRQIVDKDGPPPFDLVAIKAAVKAHSDAKYGKPTTTRLLPEELDQLNRLRTAFPADLVKQGYRMSDAAALHACFRYAARQLLKPKRVRQ